MHTVTHTRSSCSIPLTQQTVFNPIMSMGRTPGVPPMVVGVQFSPGGPKIDVCLVLASAHRENQTGCIGQNCDWKNLLRMKRSRVVCFILQFLG
jgi:hypothetical protein